MRSDIPRPSPQALRNAERRLAQAASTRRVMAGTRLLAPPARRRRMVMAAGFSLAVVTGIFAAQALQSSSPRPGSSAGPKLAAWTVTRRPDGLVNIYLRQLRDPAGLRALLRKDGVPARIEFVRHPFEATTSPDVIPRSCAAPPLSDKANLHLQDKIFPLPGGSNVPAALALVIRPSALPAGIGMFWQVGIAKGRKAPLFAWNLDLVLATPRCTGQ